MNEIIFDPNLTFKEIVDNIEVLKAQVQGILTSFSCFETKKEIEFKRELRRQIYALNFEEWKRERILECIYDYFEVEKLKRIK